MSEQLLSGAEFEKVINDILDHCRETLIHKGEEYRKLYPLYKNNEIEVSDFAVDRFHNFKQGNNLLGLTPEQLLGAYMMKHVTSVYDIINDVETVSADYVDEKIGDNINYLLLLRALLVERKRIV